MEEGLTRSLPVFSDFLPYHDSIELLWAGKWTDGQQSL